MANNRDDRTKIDFTVADRLMLAEISEKLDNLNGIKDQVIKNTTTIKLFKWLMPGIITLMIAAKLFGF